MPRGTSSRVAASWNEGKQAGGQRPDSCGVGGGEVLTKKMTDQKTWSAVISVCGGSNLQSAVSGGGMFNEIWGTRCI